MEAVKKRCSRCRKLFPATTDYFYANQRGSYGLQGRCKPCQLSAEKGKRVENPGKKTPTHQQTNRGGDYAYHPKMPAIKEEREALRAEGKKRCLSCAEIKPLDGFHFKRTYVYTDGKDGFLNTCIDCHSSPEEAKVLREKEAQRVEKLTKREEGDTRDRRKENQTPRAIESRQHYKAKEKIANALERERKANLKLEGLCECSSCGEIKTYNKETFLWSRRKKGLSDKCIACSVAAKPRIKRGPRPTLSPEEVQRRKQACDTKRRRAAGQMPRVLLSPEEAARRAREQRRNSRQRRKTKVRALEGNFTEQQFTVKTQAQGHLCYWTGVRLPEERSEYDADHVIPVDLRGRNDITNIVAASRAANGVKRELLPWDFLGVQFCHYLRAQARVPHGALSPIKWKPRLVEGVEAKRIAERYPIYPIERLEHDPAI